jgi:hypothetical protein
MEAMVKFTRNRCRKSRTSDDRSMPQRRRDQRMGLLQIAQSQVDFSLSMAHQTMTWTLGAYGAILAACLISPVWAAHTEPNARVVVWLTVSLLLPLIATAGTVSWFGEIHRLVRASVGIYALELELGLRNAQDPASEFGGRPGTRQYETYFGALTMFIGGGAAGFVLGLVLGADPGVRAWGPMLPLGPAILISLVPWASGVVLFGEITVSAVLGGRILRLAKQLVPSATVDRTGAS